MERDRGEQKLEESIRIEFFGNVCLVDFESLVFPEKDSIKYSPVLLTRLALQRLVDRGYEITDLNIPLIGSRFTGTHDYFGGSGGTYSHSENDCQTIGFVCLVKQEEATLNATISAPIPQLVEPVAIKP